MRMPNRPVLTAAVAASAVWLGGCFLGADESGPSAEQKKRSETSVAQGSGDLQTAVSSMQSSQYKYGKEDLTELKSAQASYAEAARLNPANSRAQLGLALTNILVAAQDPRLADILNRTVEGKSPFDSKLAEDAPMLRSGVLAKVADASTWPEFHAIQDSIAKVLLPALEDAIDRIDIAYRDPAFSMTLTIGGKVRELDHVEAGVLLAGVKALHGLVTLWLSYDIDLDYQGSYDWITALQDLGQVKKFSDLTDAQRDALKKGTELIGPDSPYLTIRSGWGDRLAKVDDEILAALNILRESLASLAKETDAQDDDLLHLCAPLEVGSCLAPSAYRQAQDGVDTARKYMQQPYLVRLDDIDTTIRVDFSAYFRVQDFKKMLPYYGFYDPKDWSDDKPALYFTDRAGNITGNIMTVKRISDEADSLGTPAAEVVARLRAVIHLQDPTFQGYLPGATENDVWNILLKKAELNDQRKPVAVALSNDAVSTLRPDFALGLTKN
jgi:hypothetical protein